MSKSPESDVDRELAEEVFENQKSSPEWPSRVSDFPILSRCKVIFVS